RRAQRVGDDAIEDRLGAIFKDRHECGSSELAAGRALGRECADRFVHVRRRIRSRLVSFERAHERNARPVLRYYSLDASPHVAPRARLRALARRCVVTSIRAFIRERSGLATIEYVVGAAVILGTLVIGVSAWNNGLVTRLQSLVTQLAGVR